MVTRHLTCTQTCVLEHRQSLWTYSFSPAAAVPPSKHWTCWFYCVWLGAVDTVFGASVSYSRANQQATWCSPYTELRLFFGPPRLYVSVLILRLGWFVISFLSSRCLQRQYIRMGRDGGSSEHFSIFLVVKLCVRFNLHKLMLLRKQVHINKHNDSRKVNKSLNSWMQGIDF